MIHPSKKKLLNFKNIHSNFLRKKYDVTNFFEIIRTRNILEIKYSRFK